MYVIGGNQQGSLAVWVDHTVCEKADLWVPTVCTPVGTFGYPQPSGYFLRLIAVLTKDLWVLFSVTHGIILIVVIILTKASSASLFNF